MSELPPHLKAYVCIHIYEGERPVLLVSRPDGDWCFLCGDGHDPAAQDFRVVGIEHVLARDPSLTSVPDLPPGWEAERTDPTAVWRRLPVPPEVD